MGRGGVDNRDCKLAATPRHFAQRYCFCQYLFIIDDYFPAFSI